MVLLALLAAIILALGTVSALQTSLWGGEGVALALLLVWPLAWILSICIIRIALLIARFSWDEDPVWNSDLDPRMRLMLGVAVWLIGLFLSSILQQAWPAIAIILVGDTCTIYVVFRLFQSLHRGSTC